MLLSDALSGKKTSSFSFCSLHIQYLHLHTLRKKLGLYLLLITNYVFILAILKETCIGS